MSEILIDHLWESTLFAAAAGVMTLAFRNNGAHVRYWLWFAASVKFLMPFALLTTLGRHAGPQSIAVATPAPVAIVLETLAAPITFDAAAAGTGKIDWTIVLAAIWACGFIVVTTLWAARWLRIRGALRGAVALDIEAPVPVKVTSSGLEPGLAGIFRPVLLLPQGIAQQLTENEFRAVLAHEVCHWRRRDNMTAAIHMLAQAMFWFHPLLWWLGTRLVAERENACDEAVVRSGGAPGVYAEGILKVCKLYAASPLICASGVSGADLRARIERIMRDRIADKISPAKLALIAATAFVALAGPLMIGWTSRPGHAAAPRAPVYVDIPGLDRKFGDVMAAIALEIDCASPECQVERDAVGSAMPQITEALSYELGQLRFEDVKGSEKVLALKDAFLTRARAAAPTGLVKGLVFKQFLAFGDPNNSSPRSRHYTQLYLNTDRPRFPPRTSQKTVDPEGVVLTQQPSVKVRSGGADVLIVKANILNTGTTKSGFPALWLQVLNAKNEVIEEAQGLPRFCCLEPGQGHDLEQALQVTDKDSVKVRVTWELERVPR